MWQDLFTVQIPVLEKILRTIGVYGLIVVVFRVTGRRTMASLNSLDFVVMFLLSNVVQNAIIGNDQSWLGGAIGAVTLIAADTLLDRLVFSYPWARRLIEGRSVEVISKGQVDDKALRRLGINAADIDHAVRIQNGDDVAQVWAGTLEASGQLVLTLRKNEQSATHGEMAEVLSRLRRIETMLQTVPGAAEPG